VIVVDASVLAPALADDGRDGDLARGRLMGEELAAPELVDLEVTSALRKAVSRRRLPQRRAVLALRDLQLLPINRVSHLPLLGRIWELRGNITVYDAAYVALAEILGAALLTADKRLEQAHGVRCVVELLV
jgi:predicted nucleic acid-binding protein